MEGKCQGSARCKGVPVPNSRKCQMHLERQRAAVHRYREKVRASGRCISCDAPLESLRKIKCSKCWEREARVRSERRQAETDLISLGLGKHTRRPNGTSSYGNSTQPNLVAQKEERIRLRQAGLCTRCGKVPPPENRRLCLTCCGVNRQRSQRYHRRRQDKLKEAIEKVIEEDPTVVDLLKKGEGVSLGPTTEESSNAPNTELSEPSLEDLKIEQ